MIPFFNIKENDAAYINDIKKAVNDVIDSGNFIRGEQVRSFEIELSRYVHSSYAVGVGSGLDALNLILRAYIEMGHIKRGDHVILPANTFIATALAITENGLIPVFVDPDPTTFNIDLNNTETTHKTAAIIGVHLYGRLIENIDKIPGHIKMIEDAAQAIGSGAGNMGDAAAFSFYPAKNMGAYGDGGAITTSNEELSHMVRVLSNYGGPAKYIHSVKGINSRLDEIQAAILNVKLKHIDICNSRRKNAARLYLQHTKHKDVILPEWIDSSVWHQFVIRTNRRDELQKHLFNNGVQTLIHYPIPIHRQNAFREFSNKNLPITDTLSQTILSLPITTSDENIIHISNLINKL